MNMFINVIRACERHRIALGLLSGTLVALIVAFLGVLQDYSVAGRRMELSFDLGIWSAPAKILGRSLWGLIGVATGTWVGVKAIPPGAFLKGVVAGTMPFLLSLLGRMVGDSSGTGALALLLLWLLTSLPSGVTAHVAAGRKR